MSDTKDDEKHVEVELLADGIRLGGRDYTRGDVITLPVSHADRLREQGSVGDKGSVEKAAETQRKLDALEVQRQRYLAGQVDELDEDIGPNRDVPKSSHPSSRAGK